MVETYWTKKPSVYLEKLSFLSHFLPLVWSKGQGGAAALVGNTNLGRGNNFFVCIIPTGSDDASTFCRSLRRRNLVVTRIYYCLDIGTAIPSRLKSIIVLKPSKRLRFSCIQLQIIILIRIFLIPDIPNAIILRE